MRTGKRRKTVARGPCGLCSQVWDCVMPGTMRGRFFIVPGNFYIVPGCPFCLVIFFFGFTFANSRLLFFFSKITRQTNNKNPNFTLQTHTDSLSPLLLSVRSSVIVGFFTKNHNLNTSSSVNINTILLEFPLFWQLFTQEIFIEKNV